MVRVAGVWEGEGVGEEACTAETGAKIIKQPKLQLAEDLCVHPPRACVTYTVAWTTLMRQTRL